MEKYSTVIIGGGATGICAAISASCQGESVIICEKMPQLGKKLLATGNGRCNLLNEDLRADYYNLAARGLVNSIFAKFGKSAILDFFNGLGLEVYSKEGRFFPVTNQAASVLKVLEMELKRLSVPVEYNFSCSDISFSRNSIVISSRDGKIIEGKKVIIAGGGKTYPAYGSDGSMYEIAARFGHSIIEPVPAVVPLVTKDPLCHLLQGQRIMASVKSIIAGKTSDEVAGELLFTQYGLSGTCILDVSEAVSIALNRHHQSEVFVSVDMVPFLNQEQLKKELERRRKEKWLPEDMLTGLLPNKFNTALKELFEKKEFDSVIESLKNRRFRISGTRGWNEAEFTSGGINCSEIVAGTLESKIKKGVYFAGEILDVNGRRGGYNLAWAWASGYIAGQQFA